MFSLASGLHVEGELWLIFFFLHVIGGFKIFRFYNFQTATYNVEVDLDIMENMGTKTNQ